MKKVELKDFLEYNFLSNVKMSPDKDSCIFQVAKCDEESNAYHTNIFAWRNGECIPLTQSNKDSSAMYLDNETILFKSSRSASDQERVKNGEELTSFYTISLNGGEAKKYFEIPLAVSAIEKISGEEFLVLASYNKDFSIVGREDKKEELLKTKKEEKDYEVFTKIPFCHNGGGYAANAISRLYIYNVTSKSLKAISPENVNVSSYCLKEDKSEIVIVGENECKHVSLRSGLFTYHLGTGKWQERIKEKEFEIDAAYYFNDGILFIGNREWKHGHNENGRFFILDDENIETPTLFIHSDEDYRCPLEQGLQLYTAMVDKGVDTRFVLFHGENQELSRAGKPKHRIRRLKEITEWMEQYLKR